jgi:hypothetical protein
MYKSNIAKTHFSISTAPSLVVERRSLTSEKKQLLVLIKNYLKKASDRKTTLDGLTTLANTLSKSA